MKNIPYVVNANVFHEGDIIKVNDLPFDTIMDDKIKMEIKVILEKDVDVAFLKNAAELGATFEVLGNIKTNPELAK